MFYSEQDELTKRYIVVEEDESSIWVYLTMPNGAEIDKDCFLGNRYEVTYEKLDVEEYKNKQISPPTIKDFSTELSWIKGLKENDLSVDWFQDGNILLKIKDEPFLFFHSEDKRGFSKSITKNGMYGNAWNENKYKEILK
jgi:hypothetical protein